MTKFNPGAVGLRSPVGVHQEKRYVVTEEQAGTWQIVDCATGLPAATNGKDFVQLTARDAKEIAAELNSCEDEGLQSPLL